MSLFEQHPGLGPAVTAGTFALFFAAEHLRPLRKRFRPLKGRLVVNALVTGAAFLVGGLAVTPTALLLAGHMNRAGFGLLNAFALPPVARFAIAFCLFDLTFYWWHRANHEIGLLWRFHNVHHADPDLDTTTSFRFHPGEILYSTGLRAAQVALIGALPGEFVAYLVVFQCGTVFHHSNLRLPLWLERPLNWVFVTPRMHGVHHSVVRDEVNANYSVVFSLWDRLHRSLRLNVPQDKITIGVAAYLTRADNRVLRLLALPFTRQRKYGRFPDGTAANRDESDRTPKKTRMEA